MASARAYLNALNKVAAARRDREAGHPHRSPSRRSRGQVILESPATPSRAAELALPALA